MTEAAQTYPNPNPVMGKVQQWTLINWWTIDWGRGFFSVGMRILPFLPKSFNMAIFFHDEHIWTIDGEIAPLYSRSAIFHKICIGPLMAWFNIM
jgi:hypothetical protein